MTAPRRSLNLGTAISNFNYPDEEETKENNVFVIDGRDYETTLSDIKQVDGALERIGSGRFGVVYKRLHERSGKVMAEKVVNKGSINSSKYADTEKKLWEVCQHDHLVNHYGAIDTAMDLYLYFELMATCFRKVTDSVKRRCQSSGNKYVFPHQVLSKLAYSTWSALWYLKDQHDVIHRDIKPSNVLIGFDGSIKVTDFGLAKKLIDSKAYTKGIGALAYIAPERIQGDGKTSYGSPADVWSLGIMIIELATGEHPILSVVEDPNHELSVLIQIADKDPPVLTGDYNPAMKEFTARCLKKAPKDRLQLGGPDPFLEQDVPTDTAFLSFLENNELL